MTSEPPKPTTDRPPDTLRKTVMFCPECEYNGEMTEWTFTVTDDDEEVVQCPDCGTIVTRRRLSTTEQRPSAGPTHDAAELSCDD